MHQSLWRTGIVTVTLFSVLAYHVPSASAFSFWPPQIAAATAAVTEGSTSFFSTLWCTTKSFFGVACAPVRITESVTTSEEDEPATSPSVPLIIHEKPTYITNEYHTTAAPTVIREIIREGTTGTLSQIDWNTFVKNTFFAKQIERTDDNVNDRISASLTDLEESFSTSLFSTTGNATIGGTLSVAGLTTFALGLSAQSSSTITDLTIVNATTTNLKFTALADGCLSTVSGLVTSSGVPCGAGGGGSGGSGGGTWATTTSLAAGTLINYSLNASDVVAIGSNSTTSAEYWFDPSAGVAYLSGNVGIGTAAPSERLTVVGTTSVSSLDITDGSIFVGGERYVTMQGEIGGSVNNNFLVGVNAGSGITDVAYSNFLGNNAGSGATDATDSNFLGRSAGFNASNAFFSNFLGTNAGSGATGASRSNFFGQNAGLGATGAAYSNFFGYSAGQDATNADNSNFFGISAGQSATNADSSNFFGPSAGQSATDAYSSNFLGDAAGLNAYNASHSNFFGYGAGQEAATAANSIFIGINAGLSDTVDNTIGDKSSILIGNYTSTGGFSNSIAIGQGTANSAVDQVNIGRVLYMTGIGSSTAPSSAVMEGGRVGIGTESPNARLSVVGGAFDLQAISTEAIIGDEMIVDIEDREFSTGADGWVGTNWDTSGGVAAHTAGQNEFALPDTFLTSPLVAGRYYQIEFDVQTTATGTSGFFVYLGGTFGSETYGLDIGSVSVSTIIKTVSTGDPAFILDSETWEGTIDNVSIKEVTLSGIAQTIRNSDGTVGIEFRAGGAGSNNTFVGKDAGLYNTGGAYNSFFGGNAGRSNTTGYFNTAYGYGSLSSNTTGNYNIANGSYSLGSNTTGSYNTASGYNSLGSNTTGSNNIANGLDALGSNTTGYGNVAIGVSSLFQNTTGFHNTASGEGSLLHNTTGSGNTASGEAALYRNTTGVNNTAIGVSSLLFNTTGSNNVAIGNESGRGAFETSIYNNNTLVGYSAGYSMSTTTGNLFLGYQAADLQTLGDYNIALGYGVDLASTTGSNQLNIGNLIYGTGLGIDGVAATGNVGIGTSSPFAMLTVAGNGYFTGNISAASSTLGYASTTALTVVGNTYLSALSDGCLSIMSDLVISSGVPCGAGGGGSGGGTWATTTSLVAGQSINYPIASATDIVAIGSFSTTSAEFWFDPNVEIAYFSGKIGIGTNIPVAALSVVGDISSTGNINGTGITGTTLTDTTLSISGGVITDLVSISDGTASWSGSTLSGFSSVGASTFTDGSFSVTGGNFTGVASISDGVASWSGSTLSGFTSVSGTTLTDTTLIITGGAITSLTSIFDGVASWSGNSLSGFASVSGGTLTDGVFSVSSGNFTGVTSISGTNSNFTYATSSRLGLTGVGSAGVLVINSTGVVTSSTTIGVLTGGVNGYLARWTSGSTLSTSTFLSNGTVSGINATTSTSTFNIRGIAGSNAALTVASSTGASMFAVLANGNVGVGTPTPQSNYAMTLSSANLNGLYLTTASTSGSYISINNMSSSTIGINFDASSAFSTGSLINFSSGYNNPGSRSFTSNLINLSANSSHGTSGTYNHSGSYLNLKRNYNANHVGVTLNVTGDVAKFSSDCTLTAGTCNDGSSVLSLTQLYASATGTVFEVTNGGVGNAATFMGGKVGVGSSTPSRLLTVEGEGYLSSLTIRSTSTLGYASTTALTVSGNGYFNSKVGIGSSSPSSVLSISNSILTAANTPLFTIASTTGGTSTSTLFTVLANGNVGIGTSSPSTGLHVFQNGLASFPYSQVYIEPTGSAQGSAVTLKSTFASTNRSWYFGAGIGGVNDNRFRIVDLGVDGAGPIVERINIFENGNLILNPASSNVGIGTTSPSRTLSVTGTVAFDGLTGATGSGSLCLDATSKEVVYNSGTDSCLPSLRETKHDITPLTVTGLDIINALESVSFVYNTGDGRTRFGFIAEDAAAIDAHLATYDAEGGISGIDDRSVLSVMVKAVQELYARVLALVDTVTGHEERIVELEDEIATLKAQTAELLNAQNPQSSGSGGGQEPPVVETPPEESTPDGEPSPVEEIPTPEPEPTPEVVSDGEPVPTDSM